MKNLFIIILLIALPVLGFAQTTKENPQQKRKCIEAQATRDDVKMYSQAGTSAEIITSLKTTDKVLYHRKLNEHWAIVTLDDKVGYVLYGEITNRKAPITEPAPVVALQKKRR